MNVLYQERAFLTKGRPKILKGARDPSKFEWSQKKQENIDKEHKSDQANKSDGAQHKERINGDTNEPGHHREKKRANDNNANQHDDLCPEKKSYRRWMSSVPT